MGLFDEIFGSVDEKSKNEEEKPNNDKLVRLLENYGRHSNKENYKLAFDELVEGNSMLILPSINDQHQKGNWTILKKDATLKLTSVFDQDGLKVLGAFTSPELLVVWTEKETEYTAMKSKDAIDFCQEHGIDRIVIDTDAPSMFVLERSKDHITTETIQQDTQVKIGTPLHPISNEHLKKFQDNFAKVTIIKEVYHYAMIRNDESVLILGFVLDIYTDNSRTACIHAIQNAMVGETLDLPLEMFMLEEDDWYQTAKSIENSLIYSR